MRQSIPLDEILAFARSLQIDPQYVKQIVIENGEVRITGFVVDELEQTIAQTPMGPMTTTVTIPIKPSAQPEPADTPESLRS